MYFNFRMILIYIHLKNYNNNFKMSRFKFLLKIIKNQKVLKKQKGG